MATTRRNRLAARAAAAEDVLVRTLSANGEVAVLTVTGTGLVAEAASRHRSAPTATAAMGRSLIGTLLLGAYRKDDEVTQVTFRGDGPLGQMTTIATTRGQVKVAGENPAADPPVRRFRAAAAAAAPLPLPPPPPPPPGVRRA